jgi:hypothetical protein
MCEQAREDSIELSNLVTLRHEMTAAGQSQDWPRVVQVLVLHIHSFYCLITMLTVFCSAERHRDRSALQHGI